MDQDYVDKLSPEEAQWLSNFNEEYVSGNFEHEGKRIHPKKKIKKIVKKTGEVKKLDKYKNDAETRNNKRNDDIFAITYSNNMLKDESKIAGSVNKHLQNNQEDTLIELIDKKDRAKRREEME